MCVFIYIYTHTHTHTHNNSIKCGYSSYYYLLHQLSNHPIPRLVCLNRPILTVLYQTYCVVCDVEYFCHFLSQVNTEPLKIMISANSFPFFFHLTYFFGIFLFDKDIWFILKNSNIYVFYSNQIISFFTTLYQLLKHN